MNATTARSSISRMIQRHGVTATRKDGSTIRGMVSPIRDTPRADLLMEGTVNPEATPRFAFRSLDPLQTTEALIIAGTKYWVEMVTPVLLDDTIVSYTSVILMKV